MTYTRRNTNTGRATKPRGATGTRRVVVNRGEIRRPGPTTVHKKRPPSGGPRDTMRRTPVPGAGPGILARTKPPKRSTGDVQQRAIRPKDLVRPPRRLTVLEQRRQRSKEVRKKLDQKRQQNQRRLPNKKTRRGL